MSDATMTLTTDETQAAKPNRRAASIAALAVLTIALVGGGWGAYHKYVKSAPMAVGNDFMADPVWGRRAQRAFAPPAAPPQAVVVSPGQVVTVRAPGLVLNATGRMDGTWRLNFAHRGQGPMPDPQAIEVFNNFRRRIVEPKKPIAELALTDAQKAALLAISTTPPELAQPAADRVVEICKQLVKLPAGDAKAPPLKQELEQIVTTAGKGDRAAIIATYADRAAKIKAILSPEQVQTLMTGNRPPAPKPAATPAAPAPAAG